jgi:hypothetical protein
MKILAPVPKEAKFSFTRLFQIPPNFATQNASLSYLQRFRLFFNQWLFCQAMQGKKTISSFHG